MEAREWYAEHGEKAETFLTYYFEYRENSILTRESEEQRHQWAVDYALRKAGLTKYSKCFHPLE